MNESDAEFHESGGTFPESDGTLREPGAQPHDPGRVSNADIGDALGAIADLLEIRGANPFRVRAYRNAVRTIETTSTPLSQMVAEGQDLQDLPAIGTDMASYIKEHVETGTIARLDELAAEVPASLIDVMRLPGLGPKRAKALWEELGIETLEDLQAAAEQERVRDLSGFGQKTEAKILDALASLKQHAGRFLLSEADRLVEPLLEYMRTAPRVERIEAAGSYRRRKETVGDIDLLAIAEELGPVMDHFLAYSQVTRVQKSGDTRGRVTLGSGLEVDLRILNAKSYGAALQYFTGSKEHNIKLRKRALGYGLRVSEYGVFRVPEEEPGENGENDETDRDPWSGEYVAGAGEADVYAAVDLPWIPPTLREDRGEIEAAAEDRLPQLITLDDMRGDLQMHTTWSDGRKSIEEMVTACRDRGYDYVAITDHSQLLPMIGGLDSDRLREQWEEIDAVASRVTGIRILKSLEIDILEDGSLDLDDDMLSQLDVVVVAIHTRFGLDAQAQTRRFLRAVEHPEVNILAHPTGRKVGRRDPVNLDIEAVLKACAANDVAVEINANPHRLDLADNHVFHARELGVKIVISTDAHKLSELDYMHYGVEQAQRAWLEPEHVINTWPLDRLLEFFA